MISLGSETSHEIEALMDKEIETHHHENHRVASAIQAKADALPALGIVTVVLGVIKTMGTISEPEVATEPLIKDNPKNACNRLIAIVVLRAAVKNLKASGYKAAKKATTPARPGPAARPVIPVQLEPPAAEIGGSATDCHTQSHFAVLTNVRGKLFPNATKLYSHQV